MSRSVRAVVVVSVLAVASVAAGDDVREILARSKQAAGGAAWDSIRTTHTRAKIATGGLEGTVETWEDQLRGRYVDRFSLGPASGAQGFDGTTVWSQDSARQVRKEEGGEGREAAANDAYRRSLAYWYPERWEARMEDAGESQEGERRFHVVRITPKGGRPFDLWIDEATYLIDRTVEKAAIETRTTFLSDYREVNGVRLPHSGRSTNGEVRYDQFFTLKSTEHNAQVEAAVFAIPAAPPPDFALAGGRTSTRVPFELLNNHIYVQVGLNGKGPFRLLCDTGGANIVTPGLAQQLGLETQGALQGRGVGEKSEDVALTRIDTLQVGDATLNDQLFAVFPLETLAAAEGVPQQGLIGYEVFKRFVVKVDYERSELILTLPSAFSYSGDGTVVPFQFNGQIPQVEGKIDGIPGKFDIDTGSRASLSLLGPFSEKNHLKARYAPKVEAVTGWGVGGPARGLLTRAELLELGGVRVEKPVTELSLQTKGAFTDPYVAGNVGAGVLKRFNLIFDYARQQLVFEPNANHHLADSYDRAGMWMNLSGGAFELLDVTPGGPAAEAGLQAGDRILAIDGETPQRLSLPAARLHLRTAPPGTKVQLRVRSGAVERHLTIVLRDLV